MSKITENVGVNVNNHVEETICVEIISKLKQHHNKTKR